MKKIYFIRHAKSQWNKPCKTDFERGLNDRGKKNVIEMANRFLENKIFPDIIVASPAKRTKITANKIAKVLDFENIIYDLDLYESSVEKYLEVIGKIDEKYQNIFIVAHNFTISEACERFTDAIIGNMPTCAIVGMEFENIETLKNQKAKLLFFDFPKNKEKIKYI